MRRSLLRRLLGLSLAVASLAVVATALLATYGTGSQLRAEAESSAGLLETDSSIRSALLAYARDHRGWDEVDALVRELARQTGRRIALTTPDGDLLVDSAQLAGEDAGGLPSTPAGRIDATDPSTPRLLIDQTQPDQPVQLPSWKTTLGYSGWQLTREEQQRRQALAGEAVACLGRAGIEATVSTQDGALVLTAHRAAAEEAPQLQGHPCVPEEALSAPSAAARGLNRQAVEGTTDCLDEHGLPYEVITDSSGMRTVQPPGGGERPSGWTACETAAQTEAIRPYVAPPADLYLGTSDRFNPFSPQGWWRTAATTLGVLLVAAVVTVLAGRRLVRPILALTTAAQQMATGDHTARVPVSGNDEVTRLAAAFNTMAAAVQHHDRQRRALVSDVAHELRNPLANVRGHLEAVQDGVVPLDATLVASLQEESLLLERLVADLQDLAQADAGTLRIHPEERDASDLAGQAVAAHRAQAEAAGVTVHLDAPAPLPVYADPARLRQALGNLVANAVTHTPAGGAVTVAARRAEDTMVFIVTDTGVGIASEHLPRVFDRFYRADASRSRTTGGSGLGLAITKHLVEAHGGQVEAASTPGAGSVFTIRFPGTMPD